jgi:hypothetical protein
MEFESVKLFLTSFTWGLVLIKFEIYVLLIHLYLLELVYNLYYYSAESVSSIAILSPFYIER